jgi:hypothetical protein
VPDIVEVAPTLFVTAKIRLEIIGDHDVADAVVCRLALSANRDRLSDGMIFVLPMEDAVRIRTGDHGLDAIERSDAQKKAKGTIAKIGIRMLTEWAMYPKKLGVATPFFPAIAFTMKRVRCRCRSSRP